MAPERLSIPEIPVGEPLVDDSGFEPDTVDDPFSNNTQGQPPHAVDDPAIRYVSVRSVASGLRILAGVFGVKLVEHGIADPAEQAQFWLGIATIIGLIINVLAANFSLLKQIRIAISLSQDATLNDWKDSVKYRKSLQGMTRWFGSKKLSLCLLPLVAIWTMGSGQCNKTREDLIVLNGRAISALDGAIKVADSANRNKYLDNADFKKVLDAGDVGVIALREVNGFAAEYPSSTDPVTESKKQFILGKLDDALARTQTLIDSGKLIKDPATQTKYHNVISPARAAIQSLINALKSWPTKPDPSPSPSPTATNKAMLRRAGFRQLDVCLRA